MFALGSAVVDVLLGQLQIPVTEFAPGELVERHGAFVIAVAAQCLINSPGGFIQAVQNPFISLAQFQIAESETIRIEALKIHQRKAGRIPDFITEVAVAGNALFGQLDIATLRGKGGQSETEGIGAVLVDDCQRINDVTL